MARDAEKAASGSGETERTETERTETERTEIELTEFELAVLAVVSSLDEGEIVTYGEVASEVGRPGAARAVGSTLRRHGSGVPWWRVVAANGRLVPGGEERHRSHLIAEGVAVANGRVIMRNLES